MPLSVAETRRLTLNVFLYYYHKSMFVCLCVIVVGCANPAAPAGATISRDRDVLTVRCNLTGETWYLTCSRSRWIGSVGNCSTHASTFSFRRSVVLCARLLHDELQLLTERSKNRTKSDQYEILNPDDYVAVLLVLSQSPNPNQISRGCLQYSRTITTFILV